MTDGNTLEVPVCLPSTMHEGPGSRQSYGLGAMRRCPGEIIVYKQLPTPKHKLNRILTKRSLPLIMVHRHTHDLRATFNSRKRSWLPCKGLCLGQETVGNNQLLPEDRGRSGTHHLGHFKPQEVRHLRELWIWNCLSHWTSLPCCLLTVTVYEQSTNTSERIPCEKET